MALASRRNYYTFAKWNKILIGREKKSYCIRRNMISSLWFMIVQHFSLWSLQPVAQAMSTRGQPVAPWRTSEDKTVLQTGDLSQDRISETWTQMWNERIRRDLLLEGFNTTDSEIWAVISCLNRRESLKMMHPWENRKNQNAEAPWETCQLWHTNSTLLLWRY